MLNSYGMVADVKTRFFLPFDKMLLENFHYLIALAVAAANLQQNEIVCHFRRNSCAKLFLMFEET